MDLNVICSVALGLSIFIIVGAVVIGILLTCAELKSKNLEGKQRILTPFQLFILCFFFAAVVILFPIYYVDYFAAESGFLKLIKAFLLAVQNVLRLITLNGEFDNIRDFLADTSRINSVLGEIYSIYSVIIFIAAPLLTAGFVLSFFRNASSMISYGLRPCRKLYVMSELNENSLTLATDILGNKERGRLVVFTNVFEKVEGDNPECVAQARHIGAICVKNDVSVLGLKYARKCERKIFLIGKNEDENIRQALKLIDRHRGTKYDDERLEFYVFSETAESEALIDSVDNGNMKVRRVNLSRNLALFEMQRHSIFENAVMNGTGKHICIAIIGAGRYGTELIKTICCLGQMPNYTVEIHVFDSSIYNKERFKAMMPEFMDINGKKIDGDAEYYITFHDAVDVRNLDFIEAFSAVTGYTGVYVALGEDELNIETAMRIRTALKRNDSDSGVPIYAVVFDPAKAEIVTKGGLKNMEGEEYGITFIGSLQESYSIKNIEQCELEEKAVVLHSQWAKTEEEKQAASKKFEQYEYYRRSSMMQAVYRDLRAEFGYARESEDTSEGRANNDLLRLYEHRRWNTYMRSEGYVRGEEKDHIAKTHKLLVPFDDLPEEEKKKDDF